MKRVFLLVAMLVLAVPCLGQEAWVVTGPVTVDEPVELGEVLVLGGGVLRVENVPEPGVRFAGNVIAYGGGRVELEQSVVEFESEYHGQYSLVAFDGGVVEVRGCRYRVPAGVQHGIVAGGDGRAVLEDTDFGFVQLVSAGEATLEARRLNGSFEVIVQDGSHMVLEDIPRDPDGGGLWVWPEFPEGSRAVYTPPMPGFVESWSFPPAGSSGIVQTVSLDRCRVKLWPLLVREGCDLTLRDIPEDNWVVVGFHMPDSQTVTGLVNQDPVVTRTLGFTDRTVRLENASIDTWNLYPEDHARVEVRGCVLGELLGFGDSRVRVVDSTVDGTGGYFGSADRSWVSVEGSALTCDVQASGDSTLVLSNSTVAPPDAPGAVIRVGAYDRARLLLAQSFVAGTGEGTATLVVAGQGVVGLAAVDPVPASAPAPGQSLSLSGWVGLYAADPGLVPAAWRLRVRGACGGPWATLASGRGNVEGGTLAVWNGADPERPYTVELDLADGWGRRLGTEWEVAPELIPEACGPRRGGPRPTAAR